MPAKPPPGFTVKLNGPGLSFERPGSQEAATSIINLVMTGTASSPSEPSVSLVAGKAGPQGAGTSMQNPGQLAGMTIKQFIALKRPENLNQRVACLAYYLTHRLDTPHFKTKDISKANTDAALSKLTNAAVFVDHATNRHGYLSAAGRGSKQISAFGEQVVEALPNREAVKQLHLDNKSRARRKSKKKPK